MGRWLSLLVQAAGWLIGGFLVLAFIAFVGLTATSAGTRWLASQAEQQVPGLSIGETQGNLWQGLAINQLAFSGKDGFSLSLGKAYVQIDWRQFWHFSLQLKKLSAADVILRLPPPVASEASSAPLNLADLPLSMPVGLHVLDLEINRFTLLQLDHDIQNPNPIFSLTTLQAEGAANHQAISLNIHRLAAVLPSQINSTANAVNEARDTTIDGRGALTVTAASPHRVRGDISALVSVPQGWLMAHTTLGGSLADIQTDLDARWEGFTSPSASLTAVAQINTQRVELKALNVDTLNGTLCGSGTVNYADNLRVAIHGEAKDLSPMGLDPSVPGQVGFNYQMAFAQSVGAPNGMLAPRLSFNLTDLTGHVAKVPFDALAVKGTMVDQQFNVAVSNGTLAGGALRAQGQMGLTASRPVALNLDLDHAALRDLLAHAGVTAEGQISTHLNLKGTLGADPMRDAHLDFAWSIPATVVNFPAGLEQKTTLRMPLSVVLSGAVADQRLTLKQAHVDLADASIDAKGDLSFAGASSDQPAPSSAMALTLSARVPELSHLLPWRVLGLPDLAGAVDFKAQLSGHLQQPKGTVNLAARDLAYAQWHLAGLNLNGRVNGDKAAGFDINLLADQLTEAGARTASTVWLNQLRINAQGQWPQMTNGDNASPQRVTVSAQGPLGRFDLAMDGALSQGQVAQSPSWRGRLTRLNLVPADVAGRPLSSWRLQKPAPLVLSAQEQRLGETCLAPDVARIAQGDIVKGGRLCLGLDQTATHQGNRQTAHLDADLPLALIKPWLPSTGDFPGRITLAATGVVESGQASGSLQLNLPDNQFRFLNLFGNRIYYYKNVGLRAHLKSGVVDLNITADVPQLLNAKGGGTVTLTGAQPLSLKGDILLPDVTALEGFLPQVAQLKGRAEADATLAGTLKNPAPSGHITVEQLAFTLPDTGVAYDRGKLDARLDSAGQLVFSGGLTGATSTTPSDTKPVTKPTPRTTPDDQRIVIQGTGDLARLPSWQVQARVQGQAVPVLRLPSLLIDASPDLTVDASEAGATIGGSITLPTVTARVEKLPEGVVKSSNDLVIVGEQKTKPPDSYPITGDITLKLGQAVSLAGMGFSTDLSGQLDLRLRPGKPLAALGEIDLNNGVYKAYGQNLSLAEGRLLFVGPVNDPGLAATAQRVVEGTTVGLKISGTLYHPTTSVFSSPTLPESDALSMLLTGRSLNNSGSGDRAMLLNAIAGLGVAQGNDIVRDIGQKFGFDSVGLDTTGGFGDTRLSLGKKIGDRLLVRYAVGVLNGVSEIVTQYKLSQLFSIEITTSPEATGGDLIYRIH